LLQKVLKNRNFSTILITVFVFLLIFWLSFFWFFYSFDKKVQDNYYKIKTQLIGSKASNDLIIVEIDEKTLSKIWRFPFDRKVYSKVIDNLSKVWVPVIGFDIIFEETTNSISDFAFANSIKNNKNVIFGLSYSEKKIKKPLNIFLNWIIWKGFLRPKVDNKTGVIYSIIPSSDFWWNIAYEHFSISVLKAYYSYIYNKNYLDTIFWKRDDFYYITENIKAPLSRKFWDEILINYIDRNAFNKISFYDIYNTKNFEKLFNKIDFKDKIIIIWTTAKWIKDVFNTPSWIEYWVYVHANLINTVLTKNFLVYFDEKVEWILILLLIIVSIYFNLSKSWIVLIISNLLIILLFLIIFPIFVIWYTNLVINFPIELIFWLIFSLTFSNILKYVVENKNRLKLNQALSEYVSWNIADEILTWSWRVNLNWEKKKIAIFFSDIAWFTSISEKLLAEELVWFLREYLTYMSDIIINERGFVNKYDGDSILALWWVFWEKDDLSKKACLSAIKQQRLLEKINEKRKEKWWNEIKVRMWINFWDAIIWNIWSAWKKVEFTALWDNVNLASRLEWVNKYYFTNICVSEEVYKETKHYFEYRFLDKIKVKWKKIWIKIYELLEEKWNISPEKREIIENFEKALFLYFDKKFVEAWSIFEKLVKIWDLPSRVFLDRCEMYIKNNPWENWDWIWVMKEK